MTYEELQAARAEFDLPERASLRKIRERHRQLVRRYHPDRSEQSDPERIVRINAAYRVLRDYLNDYCFDFSHQEFLQQLPEERLREQFWSKKPWGEDL